METTDNILINLFIIDIAITLKQQIQTNYTTPPACL